MSCIRQLGWAATFAAAVLAVGPGVQGQEPQPPVNIDFEGVVVAARNAGPNRGPGQNYRDFNEVTRGAEKIEGLFTLYKTGDHLYAEIRPDQFNQPFLTPVTIARGMAPGRHARRRRDRVLIFRRVGERIQVVQRNIHYKAPPAPRSKNRSSRTTPTRCSWPCRSSRSTPCVGRCAGRLLRHLHGRFRPDRPGDG